MATKKTVGVKDILVFLISGVLFFILTMPFRSLFSVFTVTEVRPVVFLNTYLGISYGFPAALALAVSNLIADYASGYSLAVLLEGFIPQFLYTYVPYLMWRKLNKNEDHVHRLDSVSRVLKYAFVCIVFAAMAAIGTSLIIYVNFNVSILQSVFFIFTNNLLFSILLGCPAMIVSNKIISRKPVAVNEKIIILSDVVIAVGLAILIPCVYKSGKTIGTYDIWNTIFFDGMFLIALFMILSLIAMIIVEKKHNH